MKKSKKKTPRSRPSGMLKYVGYLMTDDRLLKMRVAMKQQGYVLRGIYPGIHGVYYGYVLENEECYEIKSSILQAPPK